jgi:hypothetical protein
LEGKDKVFKLRAYTVNEWSCCYCFFQIKKNIIAEFK